MGVEDRDWNRDEPKRRRTVSLSPIGGVLIVVGVIAGLLLAGALQAKTKGSAATYGGEQSSHQGATKISLLPGLPGISIGGDGLYAKNDPWLGYLADEQTWPRWTAGSTRRVTGPLSSARSGARRESPSRR